MAAFKLIDEQLADAVPRVVPLLPTEALWLVPPIFMDKWMKLFVPVVLDLKRVFFSYVLQDVLKLSDVMMASIPKYEHILNDQLYVKHMVKRQLIDWSGRQLLTDRAVELHMAIASMVQLYKKLGLGTNATDDLEWADVFSTLDETLKAAKKVVYIIAHATVIQSEEGSQRQAAAKLLAKKHEVPMPLITELQKIAGVVAAPRRGAPPKRKCPFSSQAD